MELYLNSPNVPSWHGAQLKHRDKFILITVSVVNEPERVCVLHDLFAHNKE
jgi:hypothetical protein